MDHIGAKRKGKQLHVMFAYTVPYIRFADHFKPVSTGKHNWETQTSIKKIY